MQRLSSRRRREEQELQVLNSSAVFPVDDCVDDISAAVEAVGGDVVTADEREINEEAVLFIDSGQVFSRRVESDENETTSSCCPHFPRKEDDVESGELLYTLSTFYRKSHFLW